MYMSEILYTLKSIGKNLLNKWDQRFLNVAREVASWSRDPSTKIGAVAVDANKRILGTGFNGFSMHDLDNPQDYYNREVKYSKIIHAEKNLILNCLNSGTSVKGATIYVHGLPVCKLCANELAQTGIVRVVCEWDKETPRHARWLNEWKDYTTQTFTYAKIKTETQHRAEDQKNRVIAASKIDGKENSYEIFYLNTPSEVKTQKRKMFQSFIDRLNKDLV